MTDAFKKLFLGLGGDAKELAENNDVGDYIEDLEGAIKAYVDEAAGEGKELPTPAVGDIGKVVSVVSDGESGAEYALETPASGGGEPTIMAQIISMSGSVSASFMSGYKRSDVPKFKSDPTKYKISIFAMLANTHQLVGEVLCTGYSTAGGLVTPSGATFIGVMTDDAGDLYNVSIFLSDTNNTDKFVITPLTTT